MSRHALFFLVMISLPLFLANAEDVALPRTATCRIVNVYSHDPGAFTQGLLFDNGYLYESTGLYGKSTLRKVEIETGKVVRNHELAATYFGEGLALWRNQLVQLTWQSHKGFIYDRDTFAEMGEFSYDTEGWGLTDDGASLIMSDGSAMLRFLDPESFRVIRSLEVRDRGIPVVNLNELEYINGEVLANIWGQDRIARVSPISGEVLGWVDLSDLRKALGPVRNADVLNGIAYDPTGKRIFVTGKFWPKLFEIEIIPDR